MFYNRANLKKEALADLKGNWKKASLAGLCMFIPFVVAVVLFILLILAKSMEIDSDDFTAKLYFFLGRVLPYSVLLNCVFAVLYLALFRWSSILSKEGNADFKNFRKALTLKAIPAFFWMYLRSLLWLALVHVCMIPISLATAAYHRFLNPALPIFLAVIGGLLFVFLSFVFIAKLTSYLMCFFALADKKDLKILDSLRLTVKVTDGFRTNLLVTKLCFIGWGLLCIITLGIALIWVLPYFSQVMTRAWQFMLTEKAGEFSSDENKTEAQA